VLLKTREFHHGQAQRGSTHPEIGLASCHLLSLSSKTMSNSAGPRMSKWPFLLGDLLLVALAFYIVRQSTNSLNLWQAVVCLAAMGSGAWLCALPFLKDHESAVTLREAEKLASTVAQIRNLEQVKNLMVSATDQWRAVQDSSTQTVAAARELAERMTGQLGEFGSFLKKANDTEKSHLKLEVEKLRRSEGEWLQAVIHVLDHVFALHGAAARSGNPALASQLEHFQFACRDIVRRLGVAAFAPEKGAPYDAQTQQVPEGQDVSTPSAQVAEILAPGYTFQGQLVRRALVRPGASTDSLSEIPRSSPEEPNAPLLPQLDAK
jgi:molecular chaperone GrpE (heat shock protein)